MDLDIASRELRIAIIETHARAGAGHLGSSLSIVEILTVLFKRFFRFRDPEAPLDGDRFVLSKGHAALGLYCALAMAGRIPHQRLTSFGRNGSPLEPHPSETLEPELDASSGSLGQGLSIALGMALGSHMRARDDRVFVLIGDGEANEGQIWEAARCAAAKSVGNLIAILDDNRMQQDGPTPDIMPVHDLPECWRVMGWKTWEANGHSCRDLDRTLAEMTGDPSPAPKLLRARTVKGCGVPFLEDTTESHYPPPLSDEERALVLYTLRRTS
jgi:transketolase